MAWTGSRKKTYARFAIDSIQTISEFICQKVGIPASALSSISDVYQEVIFKNRNSLPLPNECKFSSEAMWKALVWFYSHSYFTPVWAIQEANATTSRLVYYGRATIEWDRVALVAEYIIMETGFSKAFGFTKANFCFVSTDPRDQIYSLRGLMKFSDEKKLLAPNYSKATVEVYRDSLEAGLIHFQNTDVLLYRYGNKTPSWIPRWNVSMLFRNPYGFGKALPWKPAGETKPIWNIDKTSIVLSLSGFVVDSINYFESYDEGIFGNATIKLENGRKGLKEIWQRILTLMEESQYRTPFSIDLLTATAMAFSFGPNQKSEPGDERLLLYRFVAYLKLVLDEEYYNRYVTPDSSEKSKHADGLEFGKPVWDFTYPKSSFFITRKGLVGCSIAASKPRDLVYVPLGSKFPFVLRPNGEGYLLRGFAFVHGVMNGEGGF